MKDNIK